MGNDVRMTQEPPPGTHILKFRGDTLTFRLSVKNQENGKAWLRTNLGHAGIARQEIVNEVHHKVPLPKEDWFDTPMNPIGRQGFIIEIPLKDVGHFEAKCFFLKEGDDQPDWPPGENVTINIEPADYCCADIIYNAFIRQFGPSKGKSLRSPSEDYYIQRLDTVGYTVIPPSGTFRDFIRELDFIVGDLGCRIIHLLPIHPTPTTYARMGRFGSPYAALGFYTVDPALAEFDPRATPLEQFLELVDAVHARQAKIFLDIAINHTGWAAALHEAHPEWLVRDEGGRIEVPGAWGVQWGDLTKLDYRHQELWQYMADVFLKWCRRGVDGFRCDAGYMIPLLAWKYIVARVRLQYPDTIFFLEGLGGDIAITMDLLDKANFNWAYSELFQNYTREQIEHYLPGINGVSTRDGIMVHFAETHDNPRLAAKSEKYARLRVGLCALCSVCGGFGFTNGVEWLATERINVHDAATLNWNASRNLVAFIRRLNLLLKSHPAFFDQTDLKMIHPDGDQPVVMVLRRHPSSGKKVLVVVNLDDKNATRVLWPASDFGPVGTLVTDLISETKISLYASETIPMIRLEAGAVLCLTADPDDLNRIRAEEQRRFLSPRRAILQAMRAKAQDVLCHYYKKVCDMEPFDVDDAARRLAQEPLEYCRHLNPESEESRVITWQWPQDARREVMIPPGHFLLVKSTDHFLALVIDPRTHEDNRAYDDDREDEERVLAREKSLPADDGTHFALFCPLTVPERHTSLTLEITVYHPDETHHAQAPLLLLSLPRDASVNRIWNYVDLYRSNSPLLLGTNGHGAMSRAALAWGELNSRYDGLLAANLSNEFPENRRIMFARCRAWIVFQGFSREVCRSCMDMFCFDYRLGGLWRFRVPIGQGEYIMFYAGLQMIPGENAVQMFFSRFSDAEYPGQLPAGQAVTLILRPDIEDRSFHETTKAYALPEKRWLDAVTVDTDGFDFGTEPGYALDMRVSRGKFHAEPEWYYMVYHPLEAERGLDPHSDLFSPGYFSVSLKGRESVELRAGVKTRKGKLPDKKYGKVSFDDLALLLNQRHGRQENWTFEEGLRKALDAFVVRRGTFKSVIAGYPWFLDWGRDSLIFSRGLIAAERVDDALAILRQFGRFEENGTLPNMITGDNTGNRDTSDAPLWFIQACADILGKTGDEHFLDASCGGRTLREIVFSIGRAFMAGTSNGIVMDPASGLICSPSHFTWMDTNFPAGTPRAGYAVEIQALWYSALCFLGRIDHRDVTVGWAEMAEKVRSSITSLFWIEDQGFLADCLHAPNGESARNARADDALRPNQLWAISLEAVSEPAICRKILQSCETLMVPGAIRSLADRKVMYPLEIKFKGRILNDPDYPYQGKYEGDEDTQRKPAYHNGTAWTWLFPVFCEAWVQTYGDGAGKTAKAWLASATCLMNRGCLGYVPEILDGDAPHTPRGCDAQAWGVSELLRVWLKLQK